MYKQSSKGIYHPSRREFLKSTATASALVMTPLSKAMAEGSSRALPEAFSNLKPLGARIHPIAAEEYHERLLHAQKMMSELEPKYDALFFAPGTSLYYFTGIRWGISERLLALVLPRTGNPILVVPGFEEGRLREKLLFPAGDRGWPG